MSREIRRVRVSVVKSGRWEGWFRIASLDRNMRIVNQIDRVIKIAATGVRVIDGLGENVVVGMRVIDSGVITIMVSIVLVHVLVKLLIRGSNMAGIINFIIFGCLGF